MLQIMLDCCYYACIYAVEFFLEGRGGGGWALFIFFGGGVPLGPGNPYPIPDHVQLILQPYTRLENEIPTLSQTC